MGYSSLNMSIWVEVNLEILWVSSKRGLYGHPTTFLSLRNNGVASRIVNLIKCPVNPQSDGLGGVWVKHYATRPTTTS